MRINNAGLEIVKTFEGYRSSPYICPAGVATIGYGATRWFDWKPITLEMGAISEEVAEELLRRDLRHTEEMVSRLVKAPLNENQFSATASLVFNIGASRFQASQIRQRLNRRQYEGAASIWWQWRRASGKILPGLVRRREAEKNLFLSNCVGV